MEFIYIYDALCGWCYGFSPVIRKVYDAYKDKMQFTVISGGLMTGERVGPVSAMSEYIKQAIPRLESMTGVKFGEAYMEMLDEGSRVSDSVPPAIALAVFREYRPQEAVPFIAALQKAHFENAADLRDPGVYGELAATFGIYAAEFVARMQEPAFAEKAANDFRTAQTMGITGFPAVVLRKEDKYFLLSRGYCDEATLRERMEAVLNDKAR